MALEVRSKSTFQPREPCFASVLTENAPDLGRLLRDREGHHQKNLRLLRGQGIRAHEASGARGTCPALPRVERTTAVPWSATAASKAEACPTWGVPVK